jgi:hypothetical protein
MLRAVIIDDERKSRENLELLLESFVDNGDSRNRRRCSYWHKCHRPA